MSANKTIEDWAKGLGDSSRTASEQVDQGDLKGWSAGPTNEEAARAVHAALLAAAGGRRRKAWHWSTVAKETLGIKRMSGSRWEEILEIAKSLGLFTADDTTFKYRILVLMEAVEEIVEVLEEDEYEEEVKKPTKRKKDLWKDSKKPDGFTGPRLLECGHTDWFSEAEHTKVRNNGECCAGYKSPPNWRYLGLTKPVPSSYQRSPEKEAGSGWPGLCCHPSTGLFIGGVGNDCRYTKSKARCIMHGNLNSKGKPHVA